MGEKSKVLGEHGESIVGQLLDLVGWGARQQNIDIPCKQPIPHSNKALRNSHGLDAFFQYDCPLFENRQQFVVVSSKFGEAYPSSPNSKFQSHMKDLIQAISCFSLSTEMSKLGNTSYGYARRLSGVLFWLDNTSEYDSLIERLGEVRLSATAEAYDELYLMDNERCAFLYDGISYVKLVNQAADVEFFHPQTGYNSTITSRITNSPVLPVQYLNSSVIPLKVIAPSGEEDLIVLCADGIEVDFLARLVSMAHALSEGWSAKVTLLFPSYDEMRHARIVAEVKMKFKDKKFASKVNVASYRPTFRNAT